MWNLSTGINCYSAFSLHGISLTQLHFHLAKVVDSTWYLVLFLVSPPSSFQASWADKNITKNATDIQPQPQSSHLLDCEVHCSKKLNHAAYHDEWIIQWIPTSSTHGGLYCKLHWKSKWNFEIAGLSCVLYALHPPQPPPCNMLSF